MQILSSVYRNLTFLQRFDNQKLVPMIECVINTGQPDYAEDRKAEYKFTTQRFFATTGQLYSLAKRLMDWADEAHDLARVNGIDICEDDPEVTDAPIAAPV